MMSYALAPVYSVPVAAAPVYAPPAAPMYAPPAAPACSPSAAPCSGSPAGSPAAHLAAMRAFHQAELRSQMDAYEENHRRASAALEALGGGRSETLAGRSPAPGGAPAASPSSFQDELKQLKNRVDKLEEHMRVVVGAVGQHEDKLKQHEERLKHLPKVSEEKKSSP